MIEHVKTCNQFPRAEAWCLSCNVPATFPTHCRSHTLSKRDTLTQKFMKPIDSIKEVGRKLSGRKSPTPSTSSFSPPSAAIAGLPKHHLPFHERESPNSKTTGRDSLRFELPANDGNTAEMPADMLNSVAMLHSDETPLHIGDHWSPDFVDRVRATPCTHTLSSKTPYISSSDQFSSSAERSALNIHPVRTSSLDTVLSDENCPSLDASLSSHFGTVSSCSTACESDGQLHTSSDSGSGETILDVVMTSSPVETSMDEELWPLTHANSLHDDAGSINPILLLAWGKNTIDDTRVNFSQHGHTSDHHDASFQNMPVVPVAEVALDTITSPSINTTQIKRKPVPCQALGISEMAIAYPNEAVASPKLRSTTTSGGVIKNCAVAVPTALHLSPNLITEKQLSCEYLTCDYTFGHTTEERRNYVRHWKRNHAPPRIFECTVPLCGKTFLNRKDNLLKHQRNAHGMITKQRNAGMLQGVQSRTSIRQLNRHARTGYHARSFQALRP